ncbi:MAG: cytidylyltransferase domain-containing protein, partial [Candidatus Kariarchaeaceae archaeon]
MRSLAVIPARGGSTRLKDKNIYPLGGKPLIRWTTEAVVNSGVFDKVLISTDSDAIFDAVKDLPVERHVRPENHATVTATALKAMLN